MKTAPIALALAMTLVGGIAQAQTVEMIVPFSAGGGTDTVARVFEPGFAEALGRTVIIRNVDGASGTIGAAAAADASADGSTVGYIPIGPTTPIASTISARRPQHRSSCFKKRVARPHRSRIG